MLKLDHLKKYRINGTPVEYRGLVGVLPGEPTFDVVFAGEQHREFWNELLRIQQLPSSRAGGTKTADDTANARKRDAELWARYIVKGWHNVVDDDGEPILFTEGNVREYLADGLDIDMFNDLRRWCQEESNFRPKPDVRAVAKN